MERNVSCLNSRAIIGYVKRHFPKLMDSLLEDLDPFFDTVDNVEEFLVDEHNWISQYICAKLFERVRLYSGNPEIAREIGYETITRRQYGYVENIFIKTLGHPHI
ncbi:MAG TPA: hypothetical protein VMZ04_00425, partial [Anaerolineae bacterium]|nr:hypothetical protein [Anaerolineae bacterium]